MLGANIHAIRSAHEDGCGGSQMLMEAVTVGRENSVVR